MAGQGGAAGGQGVTHARRDTWDRVGAPLAGPVVFDSELHQQSIILPPSVHSTPANNVQAGGVRSYPGSKLDAVQSVALETRSLD